MTHNQQNRILESAKNCTLHDKIKYKSEDKCTQ